jgi:hypothetical protein
MYGVDYSMGRPTMAALKSAGVKYVCRYLVPSIYQKALSATEVDEILGAGLQLVCVWETTGTSALGGEPAGIAEATIANDLAKAYGLAGIPIYTALDWDATPEQQPQINAYCDGWASVVGPDRTGVYGGYWPLSRIRAAGKARYYWGTYAWSGSMWQGADWLPNIMQQLGTVFIDGVACDGDFSNMTDFGQWPRLRPDVTLAVSPPNGTSPLAVMARMKAKAGSAPIVSKVLDFGDGTVMENTESASHTYKVHGDFVARATVKDANGLTATATAVVNVGPYRHLMNGKQSIEEFAAARGADPVNTLERTLANLTEADEARIVKMTLPENFPIYTANE